MQERTPPYPHTRSVVRRLCKQIHARRQPAPGLRLQCLPTCSQAPAKKEKLQTPGVFNRDVAFRPPIFESHFLTSVVEEKCCGCCASSGRNLLSFAGLADGLGSIIRTKLPKANEDCASVL